MHLFWRHRVRSVSHHSENGIKHPSGTTGSEPLAPYCPWLGAAILQEGQLLGQPGQG
jgi:hypothetical protein